MSYRNTRTWTPSEIDELVRLYVDADWGQVRLAKHFHTHASTLKRILTERGVSLRSKRRVSFSTEQKAEFARFYTVEQMKIAAIAEMYDSTPYYIRRELAEMGVAIRELQPLTTEDHKEIVRLYSVSKVSVQKIAERYDRTYDTIRQVLALNGVTKLRSLPYRQFTPEEESDIVRRYNDGETPNAIGKSYGCSYQPIRRILHEHNIKIRDWRGVMAKRCANNGFICLPKSVFQSRRSGAWRHGTEWTITIADLNAQYEKQKGVCYYTGMQMKTASRKLDYSRELANNPLTLSVDRKDSNGGYTPDNIVLCCRFVNYAKNQYAETEFRNLLTQVAENLSGRDFAEQHACSEDSVTS